MVRHQCFCAQHFQHHWLPGDHTYLFMDPAQDSPPPAHGDSSSSAFPLTTAGPLHLAILTDAQCYHVADLFFLLQKRLVPLCLVEVRVEKTPSTFTQGLGTKLRSQACSVTEPFQQPLCRSVNFHVLVSFRGARRRKHIHYSTPNNTNVSKK